MHEHLADLGVGFAVIQTVFEGESTNTDERGVLGIFPSKKT
jgi:hypothetical protein